MEKFYDNPYYEPGEKLREKSLRLFNLIMDNLNQEDFTFKEIRDEFSYLTRKRPSDEGNDIQFVKENLDYLSNEGIIQESAEKGHYFITDKGHSFYRTLIDEAEENKE